jgi:hypothetical protein
LIVENSPFFQKMARCTAGKPSGGFGGCLEAILTDQKEQKLLLNMRSKLLI